jgi:CBS domain-containing protein
VPLGIGKVNVCLRETKICISKSAEKSPSNSVTECNWIMTERRVRHLPVLKGPKLVGILSMPDVVNWLMSAQKATIDNLLLDYHGL